MILMLLENLNLLPRMTVGNHSFWTKIGDRDIQRLGCGIEAGQFGGDAFANLVVRFDERLDT